MYLPSVATAFIAIASFGQVAFANPAPQQPTSVPCTPGQYWCEGNTIYTCNGSGGAQYISRCPGRCSYINGSPYCV